MDLMDPERISERNRANAKAGWKKEQDPAGRMAHVRAARFLRLAQEIDPRGEMDSALLEQRVRERISAQNAEAARIGAARRRAQKAAGPSTTADGPTAETTPTTATDEESRSQ